ncbi:hypothetical protein [Pseudomonas sp. ADAK13]|nr:hypothetical protein [Pseudomonas sp. ADAK13]
MSRCSWSKSLAERGEGHVRRLSGTRRNDDGTVNETDDSRLTRSE